MAHPRPHRLRSSLAAGAALLVCVLVVTPLALALGSPRPRAHAAIVGGAPAAQGAFPSAAFILDFHGKKVGQCSGTVVAPSLVLTAGHCAENMQTGIPNRGSGYLVVTGQVEWTAAAANQLSKVIGVIPYPGFSRREGAGDAALLVLSAPVTVPAIALAKPGQGHLFGPGTTATIAGWGNVSATQRRLTRHLQSAATVVQPASWCKQHIHPFFPKWELCTIDSARFAASGCYGDSGGPLMVPGSGEDEVVEVGVVAAGQARCSTRYPNIYTRVDALSGWLRSWIAAYSTAVVRQPALTGLPVG